MKKGKTYVALILDKSGSMLSIRKPSLESFNDQIKALKEEAEKTKMETILSVVFFDQEVEVVEKGAEIDLIEEIKETEYLPGGVTALYDAVGTTVSRFENAYELEKEDAVLFVIVTDGMENASIEYKGEDGRIALKEKIDGLKETGQWTFTFVGTEDALDQAVGIGISDSIMFSATAQGMSDLTVSQVSAYSNYFLSRSAGETTVSDLYSQVNTSGVEED